jgi:predicted metal-binding protein
VKIAQRGPFSGITVLSFVRRIARRKVNKKQREIKGFPCLYACGEKAADVKYKRQSALIQRRLAKQMYDREGI